MGKGTYRVTQSNLRFFTLLVLWGTMDALATFLASFYWNNIYRVWIFAKYLIYFSQNNTLVPFFLHLLNIYETLNAFFSKQYLDAIGPFSYASSHVAKCAIWVIIPRVTLRLVIAQGKAECYYKSQSSHKWWYHPIFAYLAILVIANSIALVLRASPFLIWVIGAIFSQTQVVTSWD